MNEQTIIIGLIAYEVEEKSFYVVADSEKLNPIFFNIELNDGVVEIIVKERIFLRRVNRLFNNPYFKIEFLRKFYELSDTEKAVKAFAFTYVI